jgi:hypothetical protein
VFDDSIFINTGLQAGDFAKNANSVITEGYGAFSVSESNADQVAAYIARQEAHHRLHRFADELKEFVTLHGFRWRVEKSRRNGWYVQACVTSRLKPGVNETFGLSGYNSMLRTTSTSASAKDFRARAILRAN